MSQTLKPLGDRVLIEPIPVEEKTAAGIIIPDNAKEKPLKGTVISVGPGKTDDPMVLAVGDVVIYGMYSGSEISIEGKPFIIMKQSDVYGILDK